MMAVFQITKRIMLLAPKLCLLAIASAVAAAPAFAADKAAALPDPLLLQNGTQVTSAQQWNDLRRPELLELFSEHVYGRVPQGVPQSVAFNVISESEAFNGMAIHKQVEITFTAENGRTGTLPLSLYIPKEPVPAKGCFLLVVNRRKTIITQAENNPNPFWPVQEILARGYATAAFHNGDIAPDRKEDGFRSGVFGVFDAPVATSADSAATPAERPADAWGTIAGWSWGMSRAIDYLVSDPQLQGVPIALVGHSRGGKTSLWAGAQDPRAALVISNNSGNTGAAPARITRGETIKDINKTFPHWFARNYHGYDDAEAKLPVDQHELIALMAPRLVYIASASEDAWADPLAELSSGVAAAPVFELFGLQTGLPTPAELPAVNQPLHQGHIGYHVREGKHDLTAQDWQYFIDFAELQQPALQKAAAAVNGKSGK